MTIPLCSMPAFSCPWRSAICCCAWPRNRRCIVRYGASRYLTEMTKALKTKLHRSSEEVAWRRQQYEGGVSRGNGHGAVRATEGSRMHSRQRRQARAGSRNHGASQRDRHSKHAGISRKTVCEKYGVLCQTPDDFLIDQYHLHPQLVLDKLDDQAAGISQNREFVVASLTSLGAQVLRV